MATQSSPNSSTLNLQNCLDEYVEKHICVIVQNIINKKMIKHQDQDDFLQELRLTTLESFHGFDPKKATWHTYINVILVNKTIRMIQDQKHEQRRNVSIESLFTIIDGSESFSFEVHASNAPDRSVAQKLVQTVINSLSEDQRSLANVIMEQGAKGALKTLGWSKWRFYQARSGLVEALKSAGCDEL